MNKEQNKANAVSMVRQARLGVAFIAALLVSAVAWSAPITKVLNVHVVDVCSSTSGCASEGPSGDKFFQTEVNAIYAQAGIKVNFVSETYLGGANNSYGAAGITYGNQFYNVNDSSTNSFSNLDSLFGGPSSSTVYMFLVHSVNAGGSGITFGEGWLGYGGLVIAMDAVMTYNRLDTVAHELGHNLGLMPNSLGGVNGHSTDPDDLMASGSIRHVPTSLSQISTNGLTGYDQLPADQVAYIRNSSLLQNYVEEPASWLLLMVAVPGLIRLRRRS